MKKIIALTLALVLCFGLMTGCGNKPAEGDETVYKFSMSIHDALDSGVGKFFQNWANEVAELSDGRIKIEIFPSGTLATGPDVADVVAGGGADIGWVFTGFYPGQYPLSEAGSLVMEGFHDCEDTANILWDLYEETPAMQAEWEDYKLLALYCNSNNMLLTKNKKITSLADMKGMNLRSPAGEIATALKAWGANPINMISADIYQSLEKNTIEGAIFVADGVFTWSLDEQLNYYCEMPLFQGTFAVVMNKDKWESLPADLQQVMIDSGIGRELSVDAGIDWDKRSNEALDFIESKGGTIYTLPDDVIADFKAAIDGQAEAWAKALTTDTFDGMAFLTRTRELLAEYNAK